MRWFGHRFGCGRADVPTYRGDDTWQACDSCMRDFAPRCPLCGVTATERCHEHGFVHWSFGFLCPVCVARVRAAGPAQVRQIRVLASRVDTLLEAYPTLQVTDRARRRVALEGEIRGRRVWLTLKTASREYEDERYILRAEVIRDNPLPTLELTERLRSHRSPTPIALVTDRFRHVRVAFRHLGRLDIVVALDEVVTLAERVDGVFPRDTVLPSDAS